MRTDATAVGGWNRVKSHANQLRIRMPDENAKTVLIVEDNAIMADVLRRALEHGGFRVQITNNGLQALAACEALDFDAAVTDYQMPTMDGLEFVLRLRNSQRNSKIPLIFVSGKGLELDTEMLKRNYDVSHVMFKPFSPRELIESLRKCLSQSSVASPLPENAQGQPSMSSSLSR